MTDEAQVWAITTGLGDEERVVATARGTKEEIRRVLDRVQEARSEGAWDPYEIQEVPHFYLDRGHGTEELDPTAGLVKDFFVRETTFVYSGKVVKRRAFEEFGVVLFDTHYEEGTRFRRAGTTFKVQTCAFTHEEAVKSHAEAVAYAVGELQNGQAEKLPLTD